MDTVYKFAELPTKKEGIFVMPLERITILSTFLVYIDDPLDTVGTTMVLNKNEIGSLGGGKQDSVSAHPTRMIFGFTAVLPVYVKLSTQHDMS